MSCWYIDVLQKAVNVVVCGGFARQQFPLDEHGLPEFSGQIGPESHAVEVAGKLEQGNGRGTATPTDPV
eukprot:4075280-Amphidinium_carterae.1